MPYIAGIGFELTALPLSHNQGIESIVWFTTLAGVARSVNNIRRSLRITADNPVTTTAAPLEKLVTQIHGLAYVLPPVVYLVSTVTNRMFQREWWAEYALPDEHWSVAAKAITRTLACVGSVVVSWLTQSAFRHLGDQWHAFGVREKSSLVQTGPYSVVRHPMYSAVLLDELLYSVMFWSYIPLVAFVVTAGAFAIKIPIEERLREEDPSTGTEYKAYKSRVTAKVIPYIW